MEDKMIVKAWFFDSKGNAFKEEFDSEEQAEQFAKNHGLELWNTLRMHKMVYN